jgi:hypothetical protein
MSPVIAACARSLGRQILSNSKNPFSRRDIGEPNRLQIARTLNDIVERIRKFEKTAPRAVSAAHQSKGLIDYE